MGAMTDQEIYTWPALTTALTKGRDLTSDEAWWAMGQVMRGKVDPVPLAGFLVALQAKGAVVHEANALASSMLEHSTTITAPQGAVDIVGTGGDGAHTVNVSTMASLVIRGAGIPVAKHGNRAVSSKSGSADVLEALGVRLDLPVAHVQRVLDEAGISFCFAQVFHPSMKHAAPARGGLKLPTVFNVLGPITNPAGVRAHSVGVAFEEMAPVIAGVFADRGASAVVVRGRDGLDELSIAVESDVWEVHGGIVTTHVVKPEDFGLSRASIDALRGGDPSYNAQVARDLLAGKTGPVRDAVVLNAASGIVAAEGLEQDSDACLAFMDRMRIAVKRAEASLDSGAAQAALDRWVTASQSA
ncbi:anthranilate phosphoribosyltransferase [Dermabacter vaginalis]|nr:anthranilate phosphoribosyltransferase [Dermabacter vaginalis]